jgi:hypothetical protein
VGVEHDLFHVAGYELGPGNEDELVQAEKLIPAFYRKFPGAIKLLIIDPNPRRLSLHSDGNLQKLPNSTTCAIFTV